MNRALLYCVIVLGTSGLQIGCGGAPNEPAAPAKSAVILKREADPGKITLALSGSADPDKIQAGLPLDLVCQVKVEPSGWEPRVTIFEICSARDRRNIATGFADSKPSRQGDVLSFKARLKVPKRPGSYVVNARVMGIDPTVPGPAPAPDKDGTQGKAGASVMFRASPLKIKVIK